MTNKPDYLFNKANIIFKKDAIRLTQDSGKRVYLECDYKNNYNIIFNAVNRTCSCTCKEGSHFGINLGEPCEHTLASKAYLMKIGYEIRY